MVAAFKRLEPHLERPAAEHLASVEELRRALKLAAATSERPSRQAERAS